MKQKAGKEGKGKSGRKSALQHNAEETITEEEKQELELLECIKY